MNKLHISKGSGKMEGLASINTPTTTNPFCQMMVRQENSICSSCYAWNLEKFRTKMVPVFERNQTMLNSPTFEPQVIRHTVIRLHSYGELRSLQHLVNFMKLANANPDTTFTLWTKRFKFVNSYVNSGGAIPSNMILIFSNPELNVERLTPPKHFDKVFNVFDDEHAAEVAINCNMVCSDCMLCYTHNESQVVNELKKKRGRKAGKS